MKSALLTQQAISDIDGAKAWYDMHGAGAQFVEQLEDTLTIISGSPGLYPRIHKGVRRANLKRFPYALFYIVEDTGPLILACLHHRRGPVAMVRRKIIS